jgi:hypothetical protein
MRTRNHPPTRFGLTRLGLAGAAAALAAASVVLTLPGGASATTTSARSHGPLGCRLGHGITHVVQLTFDNVHFFRDNPNVPSDLELLPNLLHFIEGNGVLLSNNHTPLIAHTSDDVLTTLTGLYGDRHGAGIGNSYRTFNPSGTSDGATAFTYWTDPIDDTAPAPASGHDANPNLAYAPVPPATARTPVSRTTVAPAPWVPYTRAGCDVGYVGTANVELENASYDIPKFFGATSPEANQVAADPDRFKDAEVADYVGVAVHCARHSAFCASAQAVKFGQSSPTPSATSDLLPQEPGGYTGYQALFGHRYVAPQLGAGTANLTRNGYPVTNAAGNLVDLNGNELDGAFVAGHPGFPGFGSINASQTLSYLANMLESGVPVVSGYVADLHGNESIGALSQPGGPCDGAPSALGPGSACYVAQAQYYNQAFGVFFQRLAADGITPRNTLFEFSSDEGDHVAGANVGRAIQPTPASCDGATVSGDTVTPDVLCTYPAGSFGELAGNLTGLLATETGDATPFSLESDTAPEFYVTGEPAPTSPSVRTLEHDVGSLTAANPYTGTTQPIANYLADPTEEAILHFADADPARTPTFAMFGKPDYFFTPGSTSCGAGCVQQSTAFAYDHGDYAPEINTNWVGFAGPGVQRLGLDGSGPADGPSSAGANSGQGTVPNEGTTGTWADETDIRPTVLYLVGLRDDYVHDGRVLTPILARPNGALRNPLTERLAVCYKQLDSSVGVFGTDTLLADTAAIESTSAGDATYAAVVASLTSLEQARDQVANRVKRALDAAAFRDEPVLNPRGQLRACEGVLGRAAALGG